jgi:Fe-S oxidoreductase
MQTISVNEQLWDRLDKTAAGMTLCYQCGVCTAICPLALTGKAPSVRKLVRLAQTGLPTNWDGTWLCTTCKVCETTCPRGVPIVDVLHALRAIAFSEHRAPARLEEAVWKVYENGNPWGESRTSRGRWTDGLEIKDALEGVSALLYTGCISSYDPRLQRTAKALSSILKKADIDFGVLKTEEKCCGEAVYQSGEEGYLEELIVENIETFSKTNASVVLSISPHCFNMFKTIYPKYGATFKVLHYTELLAELLDTGKLRLKHPLELEVTYHDPCYLSRYHGIEEQPRRVLQSIKGIELHEMRNVRGNTLCCGGGGGRIFQETEDERLSNLRVREAAETGAQILATSCPYCIQNFEDSIKTQEKRMEVYDVAELVALSI